MPTKKEAAHKQQQQQQQQQQSLKVCRPLLLVGVHKHMHMRTTLAFRVWV
jgi:hypothetical protein